MGCQRRLDRSSSQDALRVFPSDLGWMALVVVDGAVRRLTFGHGSAAAAKNALAVGGDFCRRWDAGDRRVGDGSRLLQALVKRLQQFAAGVPDAFLDIPVDFGPSSDFQRRVLTLCRHIPYGQTLSYAKLAAQAGFPRAARAVGNCMAANPTPLLVPCHRVVRSDGRPGRYSAPGGATMKRRLLALETSNGTVPFSLTRKSGQSRAMGLNLI
jgi:methylated-DNA-[protein]-cysteine S-methyltransferase